MDQPEQPPQAVYVVLFARQFYYCLYMALVKPVPETIFDHTLKSLTKASQTRPSTFSYYSQCTLKKRSTKAVGYRPPMQEQLCTTTKFPVNEELAIMNRYVVG